MVVAAMPENCTLSAPARALAANVASLGTLAWAPFGRPETGWTVYYPRVAVELGTTCPVASEGFAAKLAGWQAGHHLAPTGVFDPLTFAAMKAKWQAARPFAHINGKTNCPPPPPDDALVTAAPRESYAGKVIRLRAAALEAYRAMVAAARRDPAVAPEHRALTIFSGFRNPDADAARCLAEGNCNGIVRATCSAHRTAPASRSTSGSAKPPATAPIRPPTPPATRWWRRRRRWLLVHARQYGFVNYVFEPWQWEWTGEAI